MKLYTKIFFLLLFSLFITGCGTGTWIKLGYPSRSSITLPGQQPSVDVLCENSDSQIASEFTSSLKDALRKSNQVKITFSNPHYLITVSLFTDTRVDSPEEARYNTSYSTKTIEQKNKKGKVVRSETVIEKKEFKSQAAIADVVITLYDVVNLQPIKYFSVSAYASNSVYLNKNLPNINRLVKLLVTQIFNNIKSQLIQKSQIRETFIPSRVPKDLRRLLEKRKFIQVKNYVKRVATLKISDLKKQKKNGADIEYDLAILYVDCLSKEMRSVKPDDLKKLANTYFQILKLTNDEGLIIASANSLARIEKKLRHLKHKKE